MDTAPCSIKMGRIYPPFVFGVIMLIRFILLYLISFSVFADCPAGESIGSYPLSTPQVFCANYIGNSCAAVCGWSSGQPAVCVGTATQQGPYRLTGASCNPHEPGGTVDCSLTPLDPSCFITPPDCTANPTDPACSSGGGDDGGTVDCTVTPNDPSCSSGGGNNSGGGVGQYQPSGGIAGTYNNNTGAPRAITFDSKGVLADIYNGIMQTKDANQRNSDSIGQTLHGVADQFAQARQTLTSLDNTVLQMQHSLSSAVHSLSSIDNKTGSSGSTPIDYTSRLDALINGLYSMQPFLSSRFSSLDNSLTPLLNISNYEYDQRQLQTAISRNLVSVDSKLSSVISGLSGLGGTGSGGGEGSGTGSSVGTADNPAHLAPSFYQACLDCFVDVDGAQSELEASKEKLKATIKTIQTDFKSIFTFDSAVGSGSSSIASCWDFGELIGQKCMQVDETWALLKALVLFIFMIAIIFMFTRGD